MHVQGRLAPSPRTVLGCQLPAVTDSSSAAPLSVPAPAPFTVAPRWEIWAVRFLLAVYLVVQFASVRRESYAGQDFGTHTAMMEAIRASNGAKWFSMDGTNRPGIYWLASLCKTYTNNKYTYELHSQFWVVLGAFALLLFHRTLLTTVRAPELRVAAMAIIALLPAHLIAGVVYAGDIAVMLPFTFAAWALTRSLSTTERGTALRYAAYAGLSLSVGNFLKVSFLMLPVAALVAIVLVWRWGRIRAAQAGLTILLAVVVPLLVGGALHQRNQRELARAEERHVFWWDGRGEMSWRSLLWFRPADRAVLDAPIYWDENPESQLVLVQPGVHSYPALLHLSVFTDVLNYAPKGQYAAATPRPEPQRSYAILSVRGGVIWSVLAVISAFSLAALLLAALIRPSLAPTTGLAVFALHGAVWFLPIMLILPYLRSAYTWGYWLSRLVVPGLWAAGFACAWLLDRILPARTRWWFRGVLAAALLQAYWQFRSLWF